jgi:hypothetical protein
VYVQGESLKMRGAESYRSFRPWTISLERRERYETMTKTAKTAKTQKRRNTLAAPTWYVRFHPVRFHPTGGATERVTSLLPLAASCELMKQIKDHGGRNTCINIQDDMAMVSTEASLATSCYIYEAMQQLGIPCYS